MRILVTGSLGTLGRPLVRELRERGHEVWGCDRRHSAEENFIRADVAEYRQLWRVWMEAQPQIVYHLAAEFGRKNGQDFYEDLWRTAMIGTRNVLELCADYRSKLAFASSSEVYGEHPGVIDTGGRSGLTDLRWLEEGITERDVILHPNEYALSKWANERQILAFAKQNPELEAMRLRFFNAYGPGEEPHPYRSVVALFCHKALRDERLPVFRGYHRTFMHIRDFIPTLANVAENFRAGVTVNIGGRDYRSIEDLARLVLESVGWSGWPNNRAEMIPEDQHNIRSKRPDIRLAEDLLGHDPRITLEEGVPETIEWMEGAIHADR